MRGRLCLLYMLLALASAILLRSEFLGTRERILLCQIWDFPFRSLVRLTGSRWRYSTPPPHGCNLAERSRAVAYCRQPASTVTPDIEPLWDPWPYICSVSRLWVFFLLLLFLFDKKGGVGLFYNWCSLTTRYSTRGGSTCTIPGTNQRSPAA
jgi:hypothetical protein